MTDEEPDGGDDVAVRVVVLFVPIVLTARLFELWVPKPLAWSVSMLAWLLMIYWVPRRTALSLRRWLIVVIGAATATFVLAFLQPDSF